MLAILKDAAIRPTLFSWFGAIPRNEIESWLELSGLRVPDDVRKLWTVTGGGDLFDEGETLLHPTGVRSSEPCFNEGTDFVDSVNQLCMTKDYQRTTSSSTMVPSRQRCPVRFWNKKCVGLNRSIVSV